MAKWKALLSGDGEQTLLVQAIPGSPWYLASRLPTSLLKAQSHNMLTRLGLVQIPLAVILLLGFVRTMMKRLSVLNSNN